MANKLVSIVVPVHNNEKYIERCISSILEQTHKNIEIMLIDDGSTDDSPKILDDFSKKDDRVFVIHEKKNKGVSHARNTGIKKAKGDYICFIDSDDWIEKEYVEYLLQLIEGSGADISLTRQPNKVSEKNPNIAANNEHESHVLISGESAMKEMLYYKIVISSWNKMFNLKNIREKSLAFNEKLAYGEGFEFTILNFQEAKHGVAIGSKKLYNYRIDNSNSTMTKFRKELVTGSIAAQKSIQEKVRATDGEMQNALDYAEWHTYCDCLNTIIGCNAIDKMTKSEYREIKKICKNKAKGALRARISKKEKMKAALYFSSPWLAAKVINLMRKREFNKE